MPDNNPQAPPDTRTEAAADAESNAQRDRRWKFGDFFPIWMQELPSLSFPREPDPEFRLIRDQHVTKARKELGIDQMDRETAQRYEAALNKVQEDQNFMDYELLRLFRELDHKAKHQQNRYRLYQLFFLGLATLATMIGSFQALALNDSPQNLPFWALMETIVALVTIFLAQVRGQESPMQLWLRNRRKAEQMRREHFRYLMNLPPYDDLDGYRRQLELSKRAADINRDVFPDEQSVLEKAARRK